MGKLIVAKGLKKVPKVQKIAHLVTLVRAEIFSTLFFFSYNAHKAK